MPRSPDTLTSADMESLLTERINAIGLVEPASDDPLNTAMAAVVKANAVGEILSVIARFLADHSGLLPDKSAVIDAVNVAIDTFLSAAGRPVLTRLIGPSIKKLIATAVESMYDAILTPPRTEV